MAMPKLTYVDFRNLERPKWGKEVEVKFALFFPKNEDIIVSEFISDPDRDRKADDIIQEARNQLRSHLELILQFLNKQQT